MTISDSARYTDYAEAFAFLGNSLLATVRQTSDAGLNPEFWEAFPAFGSDEVGAATAAAGACAAALREHPCVDAVTDACVEYTRLFIGPPRPAAAPWETMYRGENVSVGFGQATFEMRALLREEGLQLHNENHQYEDHMGIELLFLSVLCSKAAAAQAGEELAALQSRIAAFAAEHPLKWIGSFRAAVSEAAPGGYYAALLAVAEALLRTL